MPKHESRWIGAAACLTLCATFHLSCASDEPVTPDLATQESAMQPIAERYVRLVLALGEHDADTVDAYLGPESWRDEVRAEAPSLAEIRRDSEAALVALRALDAAALSEIERRRWRNLERSLGAVVARIDVLEERTKSFDAESRALYDAVAPHRTEAHFEDALSHLDELLPGDGPLIERYEAFQEQFIIPPERLDAVFRTAVDACRAKTEEQLELPAEESFEIEYVTDKSWSGYNWYQGGYHSLIQVNTDLPIYIDRALDLACHEGYPGHHVYNLLIERDLVERRGWTEFTVYALFSPRSLIAEGTANYGIEIAFPGAERIEFERSVLFPAAGLDPSRTAEYYAVYAARSTLDYAGNEAARRYLDGEIDRRQAIDWLTRFALMPPARAEQRTRFFDQYRTYVINYNLGQDLVRDFVESRSTTPEARWDPFRTLLQEPFVPSDLTG